MARSLTDSDRLARARSAYAAMIRELAGLRSESLAEAFARVPRERFLGPGPWQIQRADALGSYEETDDPAELYDNVLVALDAERRLNNGEPASLARWFDLLEFGPGVRFLHVGCGVGYYTAIAAHAVSPGGRVVAVEIDPGLAARAQHNLADLEWVEVIAGDGSQGPAATPGAFDAVFVNAGATEVSDTWLDALCAGGRLLVPLTVGLPGIAAGGGHMLRVERFSNGWAAGFVSGVGIYHCSGARSAEGEALLRAAYTRGGTEEVRGLRRETHMLAAECWLHAPGFCLTARGPA